MPFTSLIFDTAAKPVRPTESAKLGQKVRIAAYAQKSTKQKSRTKKKAIARVVKSFLRRIVVCITMLVR